MSTHAIARELSQMGHTVASLSVERWGTGPRYWNGESQTTYEGVAVTRLALNWMRASDPNKYLYANPEVAQYLSAFLQEFTPDVVHVTSCVTLSASVLPTVKHFNLPLILTLTDFWFICPRIKLLRGNGDNCDGHVSARECLRCMLWGTKIYRGLSRLLPDSSVASILCWMARRPILTRQRGLRGMAFDFDDRRSYLRKAVEQCDALITKSAYARKVFLSHGFPEDRLKILPDGENVNWGPVKKSRQPGDLLRVGYIGHVIPAKGVHVLVEAFDLLRRPARLLVFGDLKQHPEYVASLRARVAGNPKIEFRGRFEHAAIAEVFREIDVLVVPSIWPETFCHAVREAFIAGVPVIASDLGALPEAISPGRDGFLFKAGNAADLATYLQRLIDDDSLLQYLVSHIPPVKTVREQAQELLALYLEICPSCSRR